MEDAVVVHLVAGVVAGHQDGVELLALHAGGAGEAAGAGARAGDGAGAGLGAGEPAARGAAELVVVVLEAAAGDEGLRHGDVLRRGLDDHPAHVDAGGVGGG